MAAWRILTSTAQSNRSATISAHDRGRFHHGLPEKLGEPVSWRAHETGHAMPLSAIEGQLGWRWRLTLEFAWIRCVFADDERLVGSTIQASCQDFSACCMLS